MSEQVTIKKIYKDTVKTKFGEGIKTTIYTVEYPDVKMTSFSKDVGSWKDGDKVAVFIKKNGEFTNFTPADQGTQIEARVKRLEDAVFGGASKEKTKQNTSEKVSDEDF